MPVSVRCVNPKCGAKLNVSEKVDRSRAHCPKCGVRLPTDEDVAADFLADTTPSRSPRIDRTYEDAITFEEAPKEKIDKSKPVTQKKRFGALRISSFLLELCGIAVLFFFTFTASKSPDTAALSLICGVVSFLVLFSAGELINVFISIEENTRR